MSVELMTMLLVQELIPVFRLVADMLTFMYMPLVLVRWACLMRSLGEVLTAVCLLAMFTWVVVHMKLCVPWVMALRCLADELGEIRKTWLSLRWLEVLTYLFVLLGTRLGATRLVLLVPLKLWVKCLMLQRHMRP